MESWGVGNDAVLCLYTRSPISLDGYEYVQLDDYADNNGIGCVAGETKDTLSIDFSLNLFQVFALQVSWKAYAKDKDIIASEVMHEYNEGVCLVQFRSRFTH